MVVLEIVLTDEPLYVARWAKSVKRDALESTIKELVALVVNPDVDPQIRANAAYAFRDLPPSGSNVTKNSVWSKNAVNYALGELSHVYFESGTGPAFKEVIRQAMDAVRVQQKQTNQYR